jgi:hypothetical protein
MIPISVLFQELTRGMTWKIMSFAEPTLMVAMGQLNSIRWELAWGKSI